MRSRNAGRDAEIREGVDSTIGGDVFSRLRGDRRGILESWDDVDWLERVRVGVGRA